MFEAKDGNRASLMKPSFSVFFLPPSGVTYVPEYLISLKMHKSIPKVERMFDYTG